MGDNSVLESIVRELVSEEDIREIIHDEIRSRLNRYEFTEAIRKTAMEIVRENGETWIREKVAETLNGKVRLDDGWGNVKEMGTFEDYVRKSLRDQCMSSWNMERKLREMVDERLKKIAQDIVSRHIKEDLQNEVLEKLAEEYGPKN